MRVTKTLLLVFLISTLAILGVQHLNENKPLGISLMFFENGYAHFVAPSSMIVKMSCFSSNDEFFGINIMDPETGKKIRAIKGSGSAEEVFLLPHSGPYYISYEGVMPSCTLKVVKIYPSKKILELEYYIGTISALLLSLLIWREKNENNNC